MIDIKQHINNAIEDTVNDFLYYSRNEDEDLRRGVIENEITLGNITVEEIIDKFREELSKELNPCR